MKKLLVLALLIASPLSAQGIDDVVRAKAQMDAAGIALNTGCGVTMLTNLVAWNLRPRFGLLHKEGGYRAVLKADGSCIEGDRTNDPDGFATDYVIDRASGYGFDILTSTLAPAWQGPETAADMQARNWRFFSDPFDPVAYLGGPVTPPVVLPPIVLPPTPPVVPPTLPAVQVCDLSGVLAKLDEVGQAVNDGRGEQQDNTKAVRQDIADFREAARSKLAGAMTFAAKYILPAVAGVFGGMRMK
jgi:hypothetical protein